MDINGNILGKRDVFLCIPSQGGNITLKPLPSLLIFFARYEDLILTLSQSKIILDKAELLFSSVQGSLFTEIQQTYYIQFSDSLDNSRIAFECAEDCHRNITSDFSHHLNNG